MKLAIRGDKERGSEVPKEFTPNTIHNVTKLYSPVWEEVYLFWQR